LEIGVEESECGRIGCVAVGRPRAAAHHLASGERAGVAGLLKPCLGEVQPAHVDRAANDTGKRNERNCHDRKRVARAVAHQAPEDTRRILVVADPAFGPSTH
jgi:hypothetical protein